METIYVILIILGVPIFYLIYSYNRLVTKRNIVQNAWYQIDTLLQKRFDLVPNLVNTVKAYAAHEKEVLERVTRARSSWMKASSIQENAQADDLMSGALKRIFAVSESYPDLKANKNFLLLQEELTGIENKIAYGRQRYNRSVMVFNTAIQRFPTNIIANIFKFTSKEYFQIDSEARRSVEVDL